ncbi:peptidylprolyl isomerase [Chryseobacterium sp. T16E-39]|uniref:peptidylprolyl isomerase n=1 Tax=Chryseobacterium sp. T16E-39 TaxID=2015076 RepID=UPI000B5B2C50|nr:peptidylprolyl isomerase [Chryseobacterium sp. T16E-39]ASK28963.1 peptidylprolyl isomerase [Chryseobacterium sp. T16E-39]
MKKILLAILLFTTSFFFSQEVIDLKVENGKKNESNVEISKDKIGLYNEKYLSFIKALKTPANRKAIDDLLSEKVKTLVTDKILKKLSDGIDLNRKMEIFKSGHQTLLDGMSYPMIQYKYSDDKASEPKDLITVLFEDDGKIIGVRPVEKK